MTVVRCPHCDRSCAGPAGLASHIRSMHLDEYAQAVAQRDEAPPATQPPANGFVWEEPPEVSTRRNKWLPLIGAALPELRRNPKKWARLYTWRDRKSAQAAKTSLAKRPEVTDIEFAARVLPDETSALYGRYTGE